MMECGGCATLYSSVPPSKTQPGIVLRDRDFALLRGLFESRVMTRQHMSALYFAGKPETCKKRVQKLMRAGLVAERNRQPNEPAALHLSRKGFDTLSDAGMLAEYTQQDWPSFQKRVKVSDSTIKHELDVMSVKSFYTTVLAEHQQYTLVEFSTWPKLYDFRATRPVAQDGWTVNKEGWMQPDGFIRIHETTSGGIAEHCFFLEVDRSGETQSVIASKAIGYRDYYRTGGFAKRMGYDRNDPASCPFRVLMTFISAERRNNAAATLCTQDPPFKGQVWLATFADIERDALGPIWIRPGDYAGITAGTPYVPRVLRRGEVYRSDPIRDRWIDEHIPRHQLVD